MKQITRQLESNSLVNRLWTRLKWDRYNHWAYIIPTLIFYIPLVLAPMAFIVWLSVHNYGGGSETEFVGVQFYREIFTNDLLYTVIFHNIVILVVNLLIHVVGALLVALAINKMSKSTKSIMQSWLLVPTAIMVVGVGLVWKFMYRPEGFINGIFAGIGLDIAPLWLGDPNLALLSAILAGNWRWFGFWVLIWLIGLGSIDDQYHEAARVDGANSLQQFRYITLPQLKPTALFVIILTTINAMKHFGMVWVLTQGGPGRSSEVLLTWIFKVAFEVGSFGKAAAITMVMFLIMIVFTIINWRVTSA